MPPVPAVILFAYLLAVTICTAAPLLNVHTPTPAFYPAAWATPTAEEVKLQERAGGRPYFPPEIPSCPLCEPRWDEISSCSGLAPNFQNASNIILNPIAFASLIMCACGPTFTSAYPQCVDCFVQTNQCEEYLLVPNANAGDVVSGLRNVCGFGSALLGDVASAQSSQGISYTYTGIPSQNPQTTTSYGPGGLDLGSQMGASFATPSANAKLGVLLAVVAGIAAGVWLV